MSSHSNPNTLNTLNALRLRDDRMSKDSTKGIIVMLIGSLILPLMDAVAKSLGESVSPTISVGSRFFFQAVFLLPFTFRAGKNIYLPKGKELTLHLKRAICITIATLFFFTAIQVVPLADAIAVFFTMPLLVTLISPKFLGEEITTKRVIAVIIGFTGTLFIIQPSYSIFGFRSLLPLVSALGFSFYLMFTRKLQKEVHHPRLNSVTMQIHSGIFGTLSTLLIILLLQPFDLPTYRLSMPEASQLFPLVSIGFIAAIAHLIITASFKYTDASLLAPFQYAEIITATLVGWWWFNDIPSSLTAVGGSIIFLSGLYIYREEYLNKKELSAAIKDE